MASKKHWTLSQLMAKTLLKYFRRAKGVAHKAMRKSNQNSLSQVFFVGEPQIIPKCWPLLKIQTLPYMWLLQDLKNHEPIAIYSSVLSCPIGLLPGTHNIP